MESQGYIVPECIEELREVYRDEYLLAVEKPPFLLSIPGRCKENSDSVLTRVQAQYHGAKLLHRLDLDTSGLMLFALTEAVQKAMNRKFQQRAIEKTYEAIVFGKVSSHFATIDLPIARDWQHRPRQKIDWQRGKAARTSLEVLTSLEPDKQACTRLRLMPLTGRSHQLRIHLAAIGHPILGCDLYAHETAYAMSERLNLHATALRFEHPVSNQAIEILAPARF